MEVPMTTVLDDILSIATGGYKADGILDLCNRVLNVKSTQQQLQIELLSQLQQHGVDFIIKESVHIGCLDISTFCNGIPIGQDSKRRISFEVVGNRMTWTLIPENNTKQPITPISWNMILHLNLQVEPHQGGGYKVHIPANIIKSCTVTLALSYDEKYKTYEGKSPIEIKAMLEGELVQTLSRFYDYNLPRSVFFNMSMMRYRNTSRMENSLTLVDYRNIVKLLFPTVPTRMDGKDMTKQAIMNAIRTQNAKPRDFGIRDLDMLLYVWQTLLNEKRNLASNKGVALKSRKVDDMVQFIQECGGTLHGGKVGARVNFNKGAA
jgi:hypothetical protein